MPLSSHSKRLATGSILLVILLSALVLGGYFMLAVLLLVCELSLLELYNLFWPGKNQAYIKIFFLVLTALLFWALVMQNFIWSLLLILTSLWLSNLVFLKNYSAKGDAASLQDSFIFTAGLLYIPLSLHFFLSMNSTECILILLAVIASDTTAFYCGTAWGKTKIWPQISPKKSWVGSIASLGGCVLTTSIIGYLFGHAPWWAYCFLGVALNIAAQFGDFFESALKRKQKTKDSSSFLPGHGGFLDRVDSLLFALPVYIFWVTLFPKLIPSPCFYPILSPLFTP